MLFSDESFIPPANRSHALATRQRFLIRHDIVASCWMSWSLCDFVLFAFGRVTRTQCEPHLLYLPMSLRRQMFRVENAQCMSNRQLGKICACDIFGRIRQSINTSSTLRLKPLVTQKLPEEKVTLSSISVAGGRYVWQYSNCMEIVESWNSLALTETTL